MNNVIFYTGKEKLEEYIFDGEPIFAIRDGKVVGLLVDEGESRGWILRIGGNGGCSGHHETRLDCIQSAHRYGYSFVTDIEVEETA